jgi:hypothetical protein
MHDVAASLPFEASVLPGPPFDTLRNLFAFVYIHGALHRSFLTESTALRSRIGIGLCMELSRLFCMLSFTQQAHLKRLWHHEKTPTPPFSSACNHPEMTPTSWRASGASSSATLQGHNPALVSVRRVLPSMLTSYWRQRRAGFGHGTPNGSQLDPVHDCKVTIRSCIDRRDGNEGPAPSLIRQERSKSGPGSSGCSQELQQCVRAA